MRVSLVETGTVGLDTGTVEIPYIYSDGNDVVKTKVNLYGRSSLRLIADVYDAVNMTELYVGYSKDGQDFIRIGDLIHITNLNKDKVFVSDWQGIPTNGRDDVWLVLSTQYRNGGKFQGRSIVVEVK